MTRTTNIKQGKDSLASSVSAHTSPAPESLADLERKVQDLEWRLKLKPYFKEIMQERKAAWQESSISFFKDVWPVFETFAIYLARSSKVEYYRLKDYFKDDWTKAEGFTAKTFTFCKYTVLVGLGIVSCIPAVSVAVAIPVSIWTAVTAVNSGSKDFSVMQNFSGVLFGSIAGAVLGGIPVIGPGMAAGLVNGTIAGMKKVSAEELSELGMHNNGHLLGQVATMSLLGLSRGAVPVVGLASSLLKLERYEPKQQTPEARNAMKRQIKQEANDGLENAKKILAEHKQAALEAGQALQKQGVVHDDSRSLVSRVVSGVKSLFTGSGTPGRGL